MGRKSSEEVGENIRLWFAPWRKIFTQEERSVCWSIFGGKAAVMFHIVNSPSCASSPPTINMTCLMNQMMK